MSLVDGGARLEVKRVLGRSSAALLVAEQVKGGAG